MFFETAYTDARFAKWHRALSQTAPVSYSERISYSFSLQRRAVRHHRGAVVRCTWLACHEKCTRPRTRARPAKTNLYLSGKTASQPVTYGRDGEEDSLPRSKRHYKFPRQIKKFVKLRQNFLLASVICFFVSYFKFSNHLQGVPYRES